MAKKERNNSSNGPNHVSSSVDELLLAALERNDNTFETGRYIATFKEEAGEEGLQSLGKQGMRIANARDFNDQAAVLENSGDADAIIFPEINVALLSGNAAQERNMNTFAGIASDSPILSIDPEYFVFSNSAYSGVSQTGFAQAEQNTSNEYLRGFLQATRTIVRELKGSGQLTLDTEEEVELQVLGATWGLNACKVPPSPRSGAGIKVAVLGTGFDLGHPDFVGRSVVSMTFVGQPVQDLNGHETHMVGTACGPNAPTGTTPRYGIGYRSSIFVGKVLTNSGTGTMASVLAGMNWAIANRCPVIFATVGSSLGVQPAYTAAGQAALNNGCLLMAGSSSSGVSVGAPANSPTIMSVAAVDRSLQPAGFSPTGKIELTGPGVDIFSSVPRPRLYATFSGIASATAHVAGCAALWAETSPTMRGQTLWRKLLATAKPLPFPKTRVGAGLVQAP